MSIVRPKPFAGGASQQCAGAVLMVRPAGFDFNPETAASNKMQKLGDLEPSAVQARALSEFDAFVAALRGEGVSVCIAHDCSDPPKPDAIFPNNWVSFHADGTLVLYPMQAENRRRERRPEIIECVRQQLGFNVSRVVDLTHHEQAGHYLEGTGSLVLDHRNRVAFACESPRTHPAVVEEWAQQLGYRAVMFDAVDRNGVPFYHTNVMMCIGSRMAVLGSCALSADDRRRVSEQLASGGLEVIEINYDEIDHFGGNLLELATWDEALGDYCLLVMSEAARQALRPQTYARLCAATDGVLPVPIATIESLGGGSVRCMLAEVFLASGARRA